MHQKNGNGTFTSKIGFVLAAVGSAVGMGNIWMFPYRTGQYGGAAFLIPYLLFIALFGYVGLSGEFAFGRMTGTGPIGSYEFAMKSRGKKGGAILGTIPLLGSLGIAIGYAIIVGWVLRSAFGALTGSLISTEPEQFFTEMSSTNFSSVPWHTLVILLTAAVLIFGVSGGIEKINKVMMPAFFILFIIIAVRVAFLPNAIEGYKYLLVPQWEYLFNPRTWIMAMGQAFFSLSIGIGTMVTYASYFNPDTNLRHTALNVTILDTLVAVLAGVVIFPAVFSVGIEPSSGPSLVFITLPGIFNSMPLSMVWSSVFFLLLVVAALTSTISLHEVITAYMHEEWHMSRRAAAWSTTGACMALAAVASLSLGVLKGWNIFGLTIFDSLDYLTANILLPAGGFFTCIFVGWRLDRKILKAEISNNGTLKFRIYGVFIFLVRYVCPAVLLLIFLDNLGLF